jgi:hypothetical protein
MYPEQDETLLVLLQALSCFRPSLASGLVLLQAFCHSPTILFNVSVLYWISIFSMAFAM